MVTAKGGGQWQTLVEKPNESRRRRLSMMGPGTRSSLHPCLSKMSLSLFSFNFRLGPWEGCLNLNFDQELLARGFEAVCMRDQLAILWVGDPQQNEAARVRAY